MRKLNLENVGKNETSRPKRFIINKLSLLMAIVVPSLKKLRLTYYKEIFIDSRPIDLLLHHTYK